MKTLRVLLWDHLTPEISSLKDIDFEHDMILMCEVREECTFVKHHQQKLVLLLSAMRHFAAELQKKNHRVQYVELEDEHNTQTLVGEIRRCIKSHTFDRVVISWPYDYRLLQKLEPLKAELKIPLEILEDNRFLCSREDFEKEATGQYSLLMEKFYRKMRQRHYVLMRDKETPEGGEWNYDHENRRSPKLTAPPPQTYQVKPDAITKAVIKLVRTQFGNHFGDLEPFHYAVTRKQALAALKLFITERLPQFGDYQDVMVEGQPWLYHSHISFYLNIGLLLPKECIRAAEKAYYEKKAPLNAVEGFIRQILGWREYIRGIYWLKMPEYKNYNNLNATRSLPAFYWTADTKMNCIKQCVTDTKKFAYAHHIQRLMVLGNFALLAGLSPREVNEWYLIVYADAHEWVELPNVTGMILHADGGYMASKPYAASGAYINKMSNYCKGCEYNVKEKLGDNACPFNYLYWNFLMQNFQAFKRNHRMKMMYKVLDKMSFHQQKAIAKQAHEFLNQLVFDY